MRQPWGEKTNWFPLKGNNDRIKDKNNENCLNFTLFT